MNTFIKYYLILINIVWKQLIKLMPNNLFYGDYKNITNKKILIFKNILNPSRFYYSKKFGTNNNYRAKKMPSKFKREFDFLKENGCVVIKDFLNIKDCKTLINQKKNTNFKKTYINDLDQAKTEYNFLPLSKELEQIWLNHELIDFFSNYFKKPSIASTFPHIHQVSPKLGSIPTNKTKAFSQVNSSWHYDIPLSLTVFVLLTKVSKNDSHTQYLKASHKLPNVNVSNEDRYLSDEYVKIKNHEIIDLIGNEGDLIIFDPSGFHRLLNVDNSPRTALKYEVCCGGRVELDYKKISNLLYNYKKIESKTVQNCDFLSGILPSGNFDYQNKQYSKSINIY